MGAHLARIAGWVVGLALAAGAIASVFLIDWRRPLEPREAVIRPVKVLTVGEAADLVRTLPARVRATTEVTLSFQVPGVVQALPTVRGQHVTAGQMLAQLDQRDFQSRLTAARVQYNQLTREFEAVTRAYDAGAATSIEVARFRSSVERARADVELAEKALEDTTVLAPFDGVVADVFIDQFQKVAVGLPVLRMQGRASVRVEVNVDPSRVALSPRFEESLKHSVRFDFLPSEEFEATLVEFTSEADPRTQTFLAIFEIIAPDDALILPGMPATLVERRTVSDTDAEGHLAVPLDAVAIDSQGAHFVWRLRDQPGGLASAERTPIDVGDLLDEALVVRRGLTAGDRIAAAGVLELVEGQVVRPLGDRSEAPSR
jgi:RND family efflux transporter MFP subunit